jgi:hypothetical protein
MQGTGRRQAHTRRVLPAFRERFHDPEFDAIQPQIEAVAEVAWTVYDEYHKSPRKRKAGAGFADPDFELPIGWLDTRERILQAAREELERGNADLDERVVSALGRSARHDDYHARLLV